MRRLLLLTPLALAALAAPTPPRRAEAARPARQCPTVKVWCADTVTAAGAGRVEFKAAVEPAAVGLKLTYDWRLSAGRVAGGQGTASLKADATGLAGQSVVATVEVTGLPEGCERTASCTTTVLPEIIGCGFDEYGAIGFENEKARLDNFAISVLEDPTARGYLICYGGRRGYAGEAARRCERAKGYMSGVRGVERARLVTVDGGFREELTVRLVVVPEGATPPAPTPTVDPREVVIIKRGVARKSRRR